MKHWYLFRIREADPLVSERSEEVRLRSWSTHVLVIGSKSKLSVDALRCESKFEILTMTVTLIMLARITDSPDTSCCAARGGRR